MLIKGYEIKPYESCKPILGEQWKLREIHQRGPSWGYNLISSRSPPRPADGWPRMGGRAGKGRRRDREGSCRWRCSSAWGAAGRRVSRWGIPAVSEVNSAWTEPHRVFLFLVLIVKPQRALVVYKDYCIIVLFIIFTTNIMNFQGNTDESITCPLCDIVLH